MAVKLPPRRPAGRGGPIARTPVKAPPRPGLDGKKDGGSLKGPYINIRPPKPGLGPNGKKPKPGVNLPAPAPKPPLEPQPTAPDSTYNDQVDIATRKERAALGGLDAQEGKVKHEFGIEDPTNPFSRAEGLKRAFLARQQAASAQLASRGQLYSGAHERALARTRLEEEQARAELRSSYEEALNQINQARTGTQFQTEEEKLAAFEKWLQRAPDAEGEAPAPAPPADPNNTEPGLRHGTGPVTLPPGIGPIAPVTEKPVAVAPPTPQRTVEKKPSKPVKVVKKPAPKVKPKSKGKK